MSKHKDRYIIQCRRNPHPGSIGRTQDPHSASPTELNDEGNLSDRTKDLPNTYSRSTAETTMNPTGKNTPAIHLHLEGTSNTTGSTKPTSFVLKLFHRSIFINVLHY